MKAKSSKGKPALELIEEALHLLRHAPAGVHLCYYTGSVPFILGLLYFWSDMSRGAYAYDRIGEGSLMVGLLFVWMKSWQAVSVAKLRAFLSGSEEPQWTVARVARLTMVQAALQPTALFVRPVAMVITLPYGWVRAFYENAVVLGDGSDGLRDLSRKSARQALLWQKQNHMVLLCMMLFGGLVWLNIVVLLDTMPHLLKTFTGIETAFTRSAYAVFNTTYLAASVGCAYLCVNPVTKCIYALRCFYGESLSSGDDLRLGMRRAVALAVSVLVLLLCAPSGAVAASQDGTVVSPPAGQAASAHAGAVEPGALDSSIDRVLKRNEFAWRMPRQDAPVAKESFLGRFFGDAMRTMTEWVKPAKKWLGGMFKKFINWVSGRHLPDNEPGERSFEGLKGLVNMIVWGLCVLIVILTAWLVWKNRHAFRRRAPVMAEAIAAAPDLNSEDVVASQLPEDAWMKLASEMIAKGEKRLAVRAFYLATLAHLGLRDLIAIARHKSNRDYQRELLRRARARAGMQEAFGQSVSIFEGVWYGSHPTTDDLIEELSANMERIRTA